MSRPGLHGFSWVLSSSLLLATFHTLPQEKELPSDRELIEEILKATEPLKEPRGGRLPLYLWPAHHLGTPDPEEMESLLKELEARGIAVLANWRPHDRKALEYALLLGRIQKRLGLPISVNATACTYSFFKGDPRTAHIDGKGEPFFDLSFARDRKMGCPFTLNFRGLRVREWVNFA